MYETHKSMPKSSYNFRRRAESAFTLVELLVVVVVGAVLLAGFTGFYVSEQRATRHQQIEIETSQALRTALEQMSRDIRAARKDMTYDFLTNTGGASPTFSTATATAVDFTLDADDSGTISTADANEHKGFSYDAGTGVLSSLDAPTGQYFPLAENIDISGSPCNGTMFTYLDKNGGNPSSTGLPIKSIDICITARRPVVGGLPVVRTERASIQLRNVR
jgi:prepilin-type N-terminal cleavage/methylation domain-containing protein